MNGFMCTVLHVPNQEIPLVAAALGQCRDFYHCFGAVCTGGRVPALIGASSWYSIVPGGIAVRRLWLPFGIQLVFLPPYSTFVATDVERLWPLSDEAIANRRFERLPEVRRGY